MKEYFLCLNQEKTKILVLAPCIPSEITMNVFLENVCVRFVTSAKNLGVFEQQINKVVKTCYMTIKKLTQIRGFLSEQELQQLVSSDIFSHIDYATLSIMG